MIIFKIVDESYQDAILNKLLVYCMLPKLCMASIMSFINCSPYWNFHRWMVLDGHSFVKFLMRGYAGSRLQMRNYR